MADDPNQSRKGAPNRLGSGPSWLERQGQAYSQQTAQERLERQRIDLANERINAYSGALKAGYSGEFRQDMTDEIDRETKMMNTLLPRATLRAETRRERYTNLAGSNIRREFSSSSVNGQVADYARSSAGQNMAMSYMGKSYNDLERQQSAYMNQIGDLGRGSAALSERLYNQDGSQNPRVAWRIADKDRQRQEIERNLGGIHGAMSIQRSMGLDPLSQNRDLFGVGQKAAGMLSSGALDNNQNAKKAAEDLAAALENLKNTVGKTDEQIEHMRADAKKSADDFQGASGSGGGGNKWGGRLQAAGAIMGMAGEFGREVFLNQTNTMTGNRITAASLTNNLFDRRRAALAGDMTQLTALTSGAMTGAQAEGDVNKRSSKITDSLMSGGLIAGGVAAMAAGAGASATGVGAVAGVPLMALGGLAVAVGGVAKGINVLRGADANAEKLAEEQRQISLADQLAHVPGAMRQRLYDYGQGTRAAALEAGGTGDAFLSKTNDSFFLHRLESARIGTDQFTQMAQQGFAAQGSMFNSEQVFGARNMERAGMGSMGTNMGRMGSLAAAGSNNPQAALASVMEAAFTKSLDSSKALSMMVDNTAAMAGASVGATRAGIDTTGASSRILMGMVNPDMQNKEMATSRAMTAAGIMNDINSGTSTSFSDMMGTASISRAGGVSRQQGIILKKLGNETTEQLKIEMSRIEKLPPGERAAAEKKFAGNLTDNLGLGEFINQKTGQVDMGRLRGGLEQRSMGIFRSSSFMAGIDPNTPGYHDLATGKIGMKDLQTDPKYAQLRNKVGQAAALAPGGGLTSGEALSRGEAGAISAEAAGKAAGIMSGTGPISDVKKNLDDMATVQFAEMSKEAKLAAEQLGGVTEAFKAMTEASKALADKVGSKNSDAVMGASAEAAKSFEMGASTFTTSVDKFGVILNDFARGVGVRVPEMQKRSAGN